MKETTKIKKMQRLLVTSGTTVALTSLTLEDTGGRMVVKDVTAGGQTENYILNTFLLSFLRASETTYLIRQDPV